MPKTYGGFKLPRISKPTLFKQPLGKAFAAIQREQIPAWRLPPVDWVGSEAEWAIAWALDQKRIEYAFQADMMGGRGMRGGVVIDFLLPEYTLCIRVQGIHWHYNQGSGVVNADNMQKAALHAQGLTVIDIDEDHALRDPAYYVAEALMGRDHSMANRGV